MTHLTVTPTRIQYFEGLVNACLQDIALLRRGLISWAEEQVPRWEALGLGEEQRRRCIEAARDAYFLCQQWEAAGDTPGHIRQRLRALYEGIRAEGNEGEGLDLYQLMLQRTSQTEPPQRGATDDLVQRHALRIMVADAEAAAMRAYCVWAENDSLPDTHATQSIYDLSGVEELALHLGLLRYQHQCYTQRPRLSRDALEKAFASWGQAARQDFLQKHGFLPEEATTPFTPVTVDGPLDHDEYYAALRAEEAEEGADR